MITRQCVRRHLKMFTLELGEVFLFSEFSWIFYTKLMLQPYAWLCIVYRENALLSLECRKFVVAERIPKQPA